MKSETICAITIIFMFVFPLGLKAQYITLDKDGYTNVRKKPNAQSAIVDVVKKYQVFYDAEDIPCYDIENKSNNSPNWLLISTNMEHETGFIYKKNLYPVTSLPVLCKEEWIGDKTTFTCLNDSVRVTIRLQPYNELNKLPEKRIYGIENQAPKKEIEEIIITYKGNVIFLHENQFKNYYEPGYISIWLGFDGELYMYIGGGDGAGGYSVMLSIVNGDIVHSIVSQC